MADLVEQVSLDISSALADADQLGQSAGEALAAGLSAAVDGLGAALTASVEEALAGIGDLLASELGTVPVAADTTTAQGEVSDFVATVDSENASIAVDADTTDAQSAVDDLTSSVDGAGTSASTASEHVGGLALSTGQLAGVAGLAVGEVGGLKEASSLLGERTAVATTGALGLAAGIGELYHQGLNALSAEQRFNAVLGETAAQVQHVQVGDLNTDLFELTARMGATDAATRNASATIFQFSLNAGASRTGAAQFTDTLFALAARAVALKPSLGDVTDVATSMEVGLGRARSAAQQFGISISQAEINTRALSDTGKTSASDLTAYEKSVAGAEIAVERYGNTLSSTVATGAQNAAIEQRRLTAEFEDFLASAGKPLVAPAIDAIKAAIPAAEDLGRALSDVGSVAIPLVAGALQLVEPLIEPVVVGFLTLKAAELASAGIAALAGGIEVLAGALPIAGAAAETFAGEVAAASITVEAAAGPLGLIVGGLTLAASALGLFGGGTSDADANLKSFTDSLVKANGELDKTSAEAARAFLEEHHQLDDLAHSGVTFTSVLDAVNGTSSKTNEILQHQSSSTLGVVTSHKDFIAAISQEDPALGALLAKLEQHGQLNQGLIDSLAALSGKHREAVGTLNDESAAHAKNNDLTNAAKTANDGLATSTSFVTTAESLAAVATAGYVSGTNDAKTAVDALTAADTDLKTSMDLLLGNFLSSDQAQTAFVNTVQKLNDAVAKNGETFDIFTQAGRDNRDALDAVGVAAETAQQAIYKTGAGVEASLQPLLSYQSNLQTVRTALANAGQDTSYVDGLLSHVQSAIDAVRNKAPEMKDAGRATAQAGADGAGETHDAWYGAGYGVASRFGSGVRDRQGDSADAGRSLSGAGYNAIDTAVWYATGSNAGGSFAAGIAAQAAAAALAAQEIARDAVGAAFAALGISSPSRVMRDEVGKPFGQGFALGISDSEPLVASAAAGLSAVAVTSAAASAAAQIGVALPAQRRKVYTPTALTVPVSAVGSSQSSTTTDDHSMVVHVDARGIDDPVRIAIKAAQTLRAHAARF